MQEYQVTINGITTTLQLSDEDARKAGVSSDKPATKSGQAENKARSTKPGTSSTGTSRRGGGGKRARSKTTGDNTDDDVDDE